MPKKTLSIIIVNYRSKAYLEKCLDSIYKKIEPFLDFEVLVINNDIEEDLTELKQTFPNIQLLQSMSNLGFGAANNLAAKEAQGDVLLFLNPDTELLSDNISTVLDRFKTSEVAIIGSKLVLEDGNLQKWSFGQELTLGRIFLNKLLGFSFDTVDKAVAVAWVSGTALFIRRAVFDELRGFDEHYFMYFEDVDLCRRARLAGGKVEYFPDFVVRHYGGASYGSRKKQKSDYYAAQDYYFQKHCGKIQGYLLKVVRSFSGIGQ